MRDLAKYRRAVSRGLFCPRKKKRILLTRMDEKLSLLLEDDPDPEMDKLTKVFGTPEEQAAELMKEVTDPERKKERVNRILRWGVLSTLCLILLAYMVFLIWFHSQPFIVKEKIVIYPEKPYIGPWPPNESRKEPEVQVQPDGSVIIVHPEEPYTGPWPPEIDNP